MKSRKFTALTIILVVAVLSMAIYSVLSNIAQKPTITEYEFPFSITYELNGETVTIEDVYSVRYDGNGGYTDTKTRIYVGKIGSMEEDNTVYTLKNDENGRIELYTNLYPDYMMGDSEYDYFEDKAFEPQIFYYDAEEIEYGDEETLLLQGVKLLEFEYPAPIENEFVFSHISIFNNAVVMPTLLIALLAWIMTVIFVKKEKDYVRRPLDVVSVIFNFLIALIIVPFITLCSMFFDVLGDNEDIISQALYFIPALSILGIATSVALRRKGYSKGALIVEFIGPVLFAVLLFASSI